MLISLQYAFENPNRPIVILLRKFARLSQFPFLYEANRIIEGITKRQMIKSIQIMISWKLKYATVP